MKEDLASKSNLELQQIVESAILGGARMDSIIKHLTERGVPEGTARTVLEDAKRELQKIGSGFA